MNETSTNQHTATKTGTVQNSTSKYDSSNKKARNSTLIELSKRNFLEFFNNCMNSHKEMKKEGAAGGNQTSID